MAAAAVVDQMEDGPGGKGEAETEVEEEVEVKSEEVDDVWSGEAPPPVTAAGAASEDATGRVEGMESVGLMPFMCLRKEFSVEAEMRGAALAAACPVSRGTRQGLLLASVLKGLFSCGPERGGVGT
eukprot:evm.model.NODE_38965_length_10360_cov_12.697683.2